MTEHGGYRLEILTPGREFTLYRGHRSGEPSVLLLGTTAEGARPESVERLAHEYAFGTDLNSAWAVVPLSLSRHDGRPLLVLEDPGGEPLDRVMARATEGRLGVTAFLEMAIALARAVGQMHGQGLIHKDIKPSNVLVDRSGDVRLTGFGLASRLHRERQPLAPPEVITGTLAYMAPEQTGRMNRSVDARSDLYSLGATLYELLTGGPPFTAADPMEWIHCHVARQPLPPSARVDALPVIVDSIVLKLLAKNPEDRYQTAAGLESDLRRCQAQLGTSRHIAPFALAVED